MNPELRSKNYILTKRGTGCAYMFKPFTGCVKVLINNGHGWRTYDSAMVAGNYAIAQARIFWDSLVKQGFNKQHENA
tara:strand:- start:103 stop:333 length:231 start_codon:yes stop_codon:yes gene_type:complete